MDRPIDLRSDTVTRPTAGMRQAMAQAEVGDDVLGDDPTVLALEQFVAELLDKEAALFMPSGTMSNQVALRCHTQSGDEILIEANAHVYFFESGAPAALSGVMCRLIPGHRGMFSAADLEAALRPPNIHFPPTSLVCIENTHNLGGGSIWPLELITEVLDAADGAGLRKHLDGARIWNASAATGIPVADYAHNFDSASVCFSKGLGAPVGSALVGSAEFIARARRFRKQFGGGMRQSGVLAAAAMYALEHHRDRIVEDHENARLLAEGLANIPGIEINPVNVQSNIVLFAIPGRSANLIAQQLAAAGVRVLPRGAEGMRAVTHLDVTCDQITQAVQIMARIIAQ